MKREYNLVVVIPVGPQSNISFVVDTINSVQHYIKTKHKIILIDNSQRQLGKDISQTYPDIDILTTQNDNGKMGGLYVNLSKAFKYALERYEFNALLRLDDDALIIGENPEEEAIALFTAHNEVGMTGYYIKGRLSTDKYGNIHDNAYPRNTLMAGAFSWKFIRRPFINWQLRRLLLKGFSNGYELGENIQGGAYFLSKRCIERLLEAKFLPIQRLQSAILCEDHLFSLLTKVVGMELYDLSAADQPFGIAWQGLPASPEQLSKDGKKIIHSVRSWQQMKEDEIRDFFLKCRSKEKSNIIDYGEAC